MTLPGCPCASSPSPRVLRRGPLPGGEGKRRQRPLPSARVDCRAAMLMRVLVQSCPYHPPTVRPPADEVHVWSVDLDRLPADPAELADALTPDERDRADRYRA